MMCPKCGIIVDDSAIMCPNCGETLNQSPAQTPGKGMAIASMVLGIVSFLCFPPITGLLGIIFGCVAKSKGSKSAMATAGIICGAIGIVLWVVMLILGASLSALIPQI